MIHSAIFPNGVALLAFVIAFYALVARERKTPDIVHAVYRIAFLVLTALLFAMIADVIERFATKTAAPVAAVTGGSATAGREPHTAGPEIPAAALGTQTPLPRSVVLLRSLSFGLLGIALLLVLTRLYRDRNRQVFFRNDQVLANTQPMRWWILRQLAKRKTPRYQTNPRRLPQSLIASLSSSEFIGEQTMRRVIDHHKAAENLSMSAVFEIRNLIETDNLLCDIAIRFLEAGCYVQYTSCNRHPIEFLLQMQSKWSATAGRSDWKVIQRKVVVVDGYTPHFGFTDTVYHDRKLEATNLCLAYVTSARTFAGVHTAIADAFNNIMDAEKAESPKAEVRTPTLVIYEGCSALIDLESQEQFRIFIRHVIPSERLWGGMFTVFVEQGIAEENRPLLEGSADIFVQRL